MNSIKTAAQAVKVMRKCLINEFSSEPIQQWENTYIYRQIEKRRRIEKENSGETFSIQDHIRGMVYSMLSSGSKWISMKYLTDVNTGRMDEVDQVFGNYEPTFLAEANPEDLYDKIQKLGCAGRSTPKQMTALVEVNVPKLAAFEHEYGSIDAYYAKFIDGGSLIPLVKQLSGEKSNDKLVRMGPALTAEYLKNMGHDVAKPDGHLRRILGSKCLGCSKREEVPVFDVFDIVADIAKELGILTAEADYYIWAYCADGCGEICTSKNPKCDACVVKEFCMHQI